MAEQVQAAMTQIFGNYNLRITMTTMDRTLVIDPRSIKALTITQSVHSFLPSLRLTIPSGGEEYTHIVPIDMTDKVAIDLGYDVDIYASGNGFDFAMYRRFPRAFQQVFDIEGLLDVSNLLNRRHIRGFAGNVSDTLQTVANELELYSSTRLSGQRLVDSRISPSLNYKKNLVQANQTNAEFLNDLKETIDGVNDEGAYFCFLCNKNGRTIFSFRTMEELLREPVRHYLCYGATALPQSDETNGGVLYYPVHNYDIVDNFKLEGLEGLKGVNYRYFDYTEGELAEESLSIEDVYGITKRFSVPRDDTVSVYDGPLGRTTEYTDSFFGGMKNKYYKSLLNLERIQVSTYGMLDAVPGDLVQFFFAVPIDPERQMDFQYQGTWMIESITHSAGTTLLSNLLLVRSGVDTTLTNRLITPSRGR